jgi:hypothetical protein
MDARKPVSEVQGALFRASTAQPGGRPQLAQAASFIDRREAPRAQFQTFAGNVSLSELHPLHLLTYHGNWHLLRAQRGQGPDQDLRSFSPFSKLEGLRRALSRPAGLRCPRPYPASLRRHRQGEPPKGAAALPAQTRGLNLEAGVAPQAAAEPTAGRRVERRMDTTGRKER